MQSIEEKRAYGREHYKTYKAKPLTVEQKRIKRDRYAAKHPEKVKAQQLVRNRFSKGKWPRASFFLCADCDNHAAHYHHEHYDQPTSVEPLCVSCHNKRHRAP